jgi:hypothetical protein
MGQTLTAHVAAAVLVSAEPRPIMLLTAMSCPRPGGTPCLAGPGERPSTGARRRWRPASGAFDCDFLGQRCLRHAGEEVNHLCDAGELGFCFGSSVLHGTVRYIGAYFGWC